MADFDQRRKSLMVRVEELGADDNMAFEQTAIKIYRFQFSFNTVYRRFCELLDRTPDQVNSFSEIPYLPISCFRHHLVQTGQWTPEQIFESSGTTSTTVARHAVRAPEWYARCTFRCFEQLYGSPMDWCFLALLPSYLERPNASLVAMMDRFIANSQYGESGFYRDEYEKLMRKINALKERSIPVVLFGVSFALYELAECFEEDLSDVLIMETGGFKGRGPELTRSELHEFLCRRWDKQNIHSEYGMTELFSQAYSPGGGVFSCSPLLRPCVYEIGDPLSREQRPKRVGRLHFTDLGNIDSCSFIATEDLGRMKEDGSFTVEGRLDGSMIRGCNLMWEDIKKPE